MVKATRILDPEFRYTPAAKTSTDGVLARWLALRKAEAERQVANVTKIKTKVKA